MKPFKNNFLIFAFSHILYSVREPILTIYAVDPACIASSSIEGSGFHCRRPTVASMIALVPLGGITNHVEYRRAGYESFPPYESHLAMVRD